MTDLATYLENALTDVCFGAGDVQQAVDRYFTHRYFTPGYTQRTDGELSDRAAFVAHIKALRAVVSAGQVTVREAVRDGGHFADRHEVTVIKHDGTTSHLEVYLFGEFAPDGRLSRVEEISRVIDGDTADAHLAKVR